MRDAPKASWSSLQAKVKEIRRGKGGDESSEDAPGVKVADGSESAESALVSPAEVASAGGKGAPSGQHIGDAEPDVYGPRGDPGAQQGPLRLDSVRIATQPRWRYYLKTIGWGLIKALGYSLLFGNYVRIDIGPKPVEDGPVSIPGYWPFVLFFLLDALRRCVTEVSFSQPGIGWWRPGQLETTPDGVEMVIDGTPLRLSRAEILSGWTTGDDGTVAVLQARHQAVAVQLPDQQTTMALMRELGVAAGQRVFSVPLNRSPRPSWFDGWGMWSTVALLGLLAWPASALFGVSYSVLTFALVLPVLMFQGAVRGLARGFRSLTTRVHVGVDGFTIAELGRRQFVSFAQIARIHSKHTDLYDWTRGLARKIERTIHVQLCDQRRIVLRGPSDDATKALHAHLQAGLKASAEQAPSAVDLRALERRGRGVREWLGSVKTAAAKAGDYRHDWLDGRDLPAMVSDARVDTEQRIAAAAALSARSDPEVHKRLRIALHASANAPVRVAIEKALDGELEAAEIEHALEAEKAALKR